MADEYNRGVGPNWWELQPLSSSGTPSAAAAATSTSSALASCSGGGYGGGWLQSGLVGGDGTTVVDMRVAACRRDSNSTAADNVPATASSPMDYQNSCGHQLQMMGLGLASPPNSTDWSNQQGLLSQRGSSTSAAGGEMSNNFRSMLLQAAADQESMGPTSTRSTFLFGNSQWKPATIISSLSENKPIFLGGGGEGGEDHQEGSCVDDFKQAVTAPRGFSLDQFSHTSSTDDSTVTCHTQHHQQGYNNNNTLADSPSSSLQGLFIGSHHHHHHQQTANSTLYSAYDHHHPQHEPTAPVESYGGHHDQNSMMMGGTGASSSNWSTHKVVPHEFLRQAAMAADQTSNKPQNQLLHFTNDGPFWNSSSINIAGGGVGGGGGEDVRPPAASGFFPSLMMQTQLASSTLHPPPPPPTFDDDKPPKFSAKEARDAVGSNSHKKSAGAARTTTATASTKRSRSEASSTMPPFKVRKEKMGDRITALQQLVSPFGKTDTASVLSEAIEYIKFLHEQVSLLSTPYLKSGSSLQHQQQSLDNSKDSGGGERQIDLRSRGLCLVPVSSTFPVAHETSVDFWTPSFGGTFR